MKILILTNTIRNDSGWGRYSSNLISGIIKAGHEITVLTADDNKIGQPVLKRGLGLFYSALQTRKYLKTCDIVHALDVNPYSFIAWLANLFLNKPFIITGVGTYSIAPFHNWKTKWLAHSACSSAKTIVTISRFVAEKLSTESGRKDIQIINPGIDVQKFRLDHEIVSEPYILSVGALKYRKGYHISISAFTITRRKIPNLKYIIVGNQDDKRYFKQLQDLTKSLNVQESVRFLEHISDEQLKELYQRARLFILTSVNEGYHFEGYGLVFLEAAAAGLPVIGTKENGIEDAVKDGYNGILINQGDIENTAKAIETILDNENKWQTMSKNSYDWVKNNNTDIMINKYLAIYSNAAIH